MKKKRTALYLDIEHKDALEEISKIKSLEGLKSISQVVRYIILDYYNLITKQASPDVRLNAMSKELSMVLNLVTSLVNDADASQIRNEDVLQYHQSEKYVEQMINGNKKMKHRKGNKPKINSEMEEKLLEKTFDVEEVKVMQEQKEKNEMEKVNDELSRFLDKF